MRDISLIFFSSLRKSLSSIARHVLHFTCCYFFRSSSFSAFACTMLECARIGGDSELYQRTSFTLTERLRFFFHSEVSRRVKTKNISFFFFLFSSSRLLRHSKRRLLNFIVFQLTTSLFPRSNFLFNFFLFSIFSPPFLILSKQQNTANILFRNFEHSRDFAQSIVGIL